MRHFNIKYVYVATRNRHIGFEMNALREILLADVSHKMKSDLFIVLKGLNMPLIRLGKELSHIKPKQPAVQVRIS